jgi:hypothetical protein
MNTLVLLVPVLEFRVLKIHVWLSNAEISIANLACHRAAAEGRQPEDMAPFKDYCRFLCIIPNGEDNLVSIVLKHAALSSLETFVHANINQRYIILYLLCPRRSHTILTLVLQLCISISTFKELEIFGNLIHVSWCLKNLLQLMYVPVTTSKKQIYSTTNDWLETEQRYTAMIVCYASYLL